jgi:hypothetical protein
VKRWLLSLTLLLLLTLPLLGVRHSAGLPSGSELTYQVSFSLNALVVSQQGTGVVTQHVLGGTNFTLLFSTFGYGSIYSLASKDNVNLTSYFLMEMYNGTYNKSVGLGNGFPMLSSSELESLKTGNFQENGSEATVVACNYTTSKGTFPVYKITLVKSEALGTGNITLWVNASNGVIMQEYIEVSTFLGSATITAKLVNWSIPQPNASQVSSSTTVSNTTFTTSSATMTSTTYTHIPVTTSSGPRPTSSTTESSGSATTSIHSVPIYVPIAVVAVVVVLSVFLLRRK